MNFRPCALAAICCAALASGAVPPVANAALVTTTAPAAFVGSASITDAQGNGASSQSGVALGVSALPRFSANQGVLVGATIELNSTRTQTVTVSAATQSNASGSATTSGQGSSHVVVSAPGATATSSTLSASASCSGLRAAGCSAAATSGAASTDATIAVASASLDAYVGAGSVEIARSAGLSAHQVGNNFPGHESTTYALDWSGSLAIVYSYLLHAAPSLDGGVAHLELDFGSLTQGTAAAPIAFGLFNDAGEHRVGLDLVGFTGSGDTSALSTDLATFDALAAGGTRAFSASFDTSAVGDFLATYTLQLSDDDTVGVAATRQAYELTLSLKGSVVAMPPLPPTRDTRDGDPTAPNQVPEPGALALASIGLLGLRLAGRRRRAR